MDESPDSVNSLLLKSSKLRNWNGVLNDSDWVDGPVKAPAKVLFVILQLLKYE